jgi:hypothetical protein
MQAPKLNRIPRICKSLISQRSPTQFAREISTANISDTGSHPWKKLVSLCGSQFHKLCEGDSTRLSLLIPSGRQAKTNGKNPISCAIGNSGCADLLHEHTCPLGFINRGFERHGFDEKKSTDFASSGARRRSGGAAQVSPVDIGPQSLTGNSAGALSIEGDHERFPEPFAGGQHFADVSHGLIAAARKCHLLLRRESVEKRAQS